MGFLQTPGRKLPSWRQKRPIFCRQWRQRWPQGTIGCRLVPENQRRQRFLTPAYKTPDYKTIVRLFLVAVLATYVFFLWCVRGHIARRYPAVSSFT